VEIKKASVSSIPFEDNSFDIIIAIETYFFWPDLENDMKEVLRVLKPKGKLLVVSETYKNKKNEKSIEKWAKLSNTDDFMHFHTSDDFGKLFAKAGYRDVEVHDNSRHGWICGIGTKG
jgi:ubiquinone/menaquinone biosynthesis C-methylase UbiE